MSTRNRRPRLERQIGNRIAHARRQRGLSQTALGHSLGITFQQVQKYEYGSNRVSATTLWQIAGLLKKPLLWFFQSGRAL